MHRFISQSTNTSFYLTPEHDMESDNKQPENSHQDENSGVNAIIEEPLKTKTDLDVTFERLISLIVDT